MKEAYLYLPFHFLPKTMTTKPVRAIRHEVYIIQVSGCLSVNLVHLVKNVHQHQAHTVINMVPIRTFSIL